MNEPTQRQLEVARLISRCQRTLGRAPTIRELTLTLGVASTHTVANHLEALQRKGLVTWEPGKARTLAVTARGRALLGERGAA